MSLELDHVIYAGRDLEPMMREFATLTGVTPAMGGRHPGLGTMNALASLGTDVYFELLAVDPSQPPGDNWGARIDALPFPRLFGYMLRSRELEAVRKTLLQHGIGADLFDASRNTPEGKTLRWRLLVPHENSLGDFVPKCIDWLDTVHPATTTVPGCTFESFEMGHPRAEVLRSLLRALGAELGADLAVEYADRPYFRLRIRTPKGPLVLTG